MVLGELLSSYRARLYNAASNYFNNDTNPISNQTSKSGIAALVLTAMLGGCAAKVRGTGDAVLDKIAAMDVLDQASILVHGEEVFNDKCGRCHPNGEGNERYGIKAVFGKSYEEMVEIINNGSGKMRPVKGFLPEDAEAVYAHTKRLERERPQQ